MLHKRHLSFWFALFSIFGGVLFGLSFLGIQLGALAFIAFAPLIFVCSKARPVHCYIYGLLMGLSAVLVSSYWVYYFLNNLTQSRTQSIGIFTLYLVYSANLFGLLALGLSVLKTYLSRGLVYFVAPLFFVAAFSFYPQLFELSPALTQVNFPLMTAPVSVLSHWSLGLFIIFINLVCAQWLGSLNSTALLKIGGRRFAPVLALVFAFAVYLGVGGFILSKNTGIEGAKILKLGFHQPLDPVHNDAKHLPQGYTQAYPKELADSYLLAEQGAELIVWPESRPKGLLEYAWVKEAYRHHAAKMQADLLVQDLGWVEGKVKANRSLLFTRFDEEYSYDKAKRIPFGEYIPQYFSRLGLEGVLKKLFEGVYKPVLKGNGPQLFEASGVQILPLICYEILDADYVYRALQQHPETQLIILQSNDSWFFSRRQVYMHNAFAALRAIESGRPILHVVNGGPSFLNTPDGKVTVVGEYDKRGAFLVDINLATEGRSSLPSFISSSALSKLSALVAVLAFTVCFFKSRKRLNS